MKLMLATVAANLVSLACVGGAIWLAIHQQEGWGWFLFVALLCTGSAIIGNSNTTKEEL